MRNGNQSWRLQSKCQDLSLDLVDKIFFPSTGETGTAARKFCFDCPVKRECLDFALENREVGCWGGTTGLERKQLYKVKPSLLVDRRRSVPQQRNPVESTQQVVAIVHLAVLDMSPDALQAVLELAEELLKAL